MPYVCVPASSCQCSIPPVSLFSLSTLALFSLASADKKRREKSASLGPLAPLSMGMAYFALHLGMIHIDGCSVNPARSFGAANASNEWGDHWVFWVAPILGSLFGAVGYHLFDEKEATHDEIVEVGVEKETELC